LAISIDHALVIEAPGVHVHVPSTSPTIAARTTVAAIGVRRGIAGKPPPGAAATTAAPTAAATVAGLRRGGRLARIAVLTGRTFLIPPSAAGWARPTTARIATKSMSTAGAGRATGLAVSDCPPAKDRKCVAHPDGVPGSVQGYP
jgi:hypothetical protein